MILAAGLTPAYQQILVFDGFNPGEVNRAREVYKCASGKVLNVGLALHHLGGPQLTLALVGGLEGENIDRELTALGVRHRWIWTPKSTRACTTILDRSNGTVTELVENAAPLEAAQLDQFREAYNEIAGQSNVAVLSGSLPPGTPRTFYRDLIGSGTARIILDASGPELLNALPLRPFCAKPNRVELAKTLGKDLTTDEDMRAALSEIRRMGAVWAVVSEGSRALWASGPQNTFKFHPARVAAVNPIGSGDCLAAGMAWALHEGMEMIEAIQFGVAAAADNAAMMLPARLDPARVRALQSQITWEPA